LTAPNVRACCHGTIDGASSTVAAAVDAALLRAAHQNGGRIAPHRLGDGIANVPRVSPISASMRSSMPGERARRGDF
jgi:hypothetical protein